MVVPGVGEGLASIYLGGRSCEHVDCGMALSQLSGLSATARAKSGIMHMATWLLDFPAWYLLPRACNNHIGM